MFLFYDFKNTCSPLRSNLTKNATSSKIFHIFFSFFDIKPVSLGSSAKISRGHSKLCAHFSLCCSPLGREQVSNSVHSANTFVGEAKRIVRHQFTVSSSVWLSMSAEIIIQVQIP